MHVIICRMTFSILLLVWIQCCLLQMEKLLTRRRWYAKRFYTNVWKKAIQNGHIHATQSITVRFGYFPDLSEHWSRSSIYSNILVILKGMLLTDKIKSNFLCKAVDPTGDGTGIVCLFLWGHVQCSIAHVPRPGYGMLYFVLAGYFQFVRRYPWTAYQLHKQHTFGGSTMHSLLSRLT